MKELLSNCALSRSATQSVRSTRVPRQSARDGTAIASDEVAVLSVQDGCGNAGNVQHVGGRCLGSPAVVVV